jgi:uncharacterized LabA/DUF88 family protein
MKKPNALLRTNAVMLVSFLSCLLLKQDVSALLPPHTAYRLTTRPRLGRSGSLFRLLSAAFPLEENEESVNENSLSDIQETKRLIEAQQKQIDTLMEVLASSNGNSNVTQQQESEECDPAPMQPLKVMLFIDGTWLYYSIHEREDEWCPIRQRYGKGWQFKYNIDWSGLPRAICQALQNQETNIGWSSILPGSSEAARPIEVVRASVFTSYKADTPKTSFRYQMFQEMLNAKYDVHMLETVGKGEKCVDIQLAVDMLHYATVPNAYDVALLLTGDMDFMPAMVRTRQKGRRVGLVSMRRACNRVLYETANIKDYDVIWLEDHLDEFVREKPQSELRKSNPSISEFALMKIVSDFIANSGRPRVSSRDIGKYIKTLMIGDRCVLNEVKETYGGLYQFLIVSGIYVVEKADNVKAFWVALCENVNSRLIEEEKKTHFTAAEKKFFVEYSLDSLENKEKLYWHTFHDSGSIETLVDMPMMPNPTSTISQIDLPEALSPDYSNYKVAELKEACRERNLPVSGKKADLIERLLGSEEEERQHGQASAPEEVKPAAYVQGLILEYLQVKGGQASSRDVGRYMAANQASDERQKEENTRISALTELKEIYGSLKQYVFQSELFSAEEMKSEEAYEYRIRLNDRSKEV